MDRELVNTQIVLMRKIVRNVKRFVSQRILKQIKVLQIKQNNINNNKNEKIKSKIANKITNKKKELIAIKGVNVDEVSKQALLYDKSHFDDLIKNNDSNLSERAIARISIHEYIIKAVNKFKKDNPNCELWLPSQIELWHQKKLIKRNKINEKKSLQKENITKNEENDESIEKSINSNKSVKPVSESSESKNSTLKQKVKNKNKKAVIKRIEVNKNDSKMINLDNEVDNNEDNEENDETLEKEENSNERNVVPKADPFFLSDKLEVNDEQSDESINNEITINRRIDNKNRKTFSQRNNKKDSKYWKVSDKMKPNSVKHSKPVINDHKKGRKNVKQPKNNESIKKSKDGQNSDQNNGLNTEKMHPSWEAKRLMKDKFKFSLNQKPIAKRIKFDDN